MKSKLLLVCVLVLSVILQGCSCDKFDINTYNSAVSNYTNSTGLDYNLIVRTETEGSNTVVQEESEYQYQFTTTRVVKNFASTIEKYAIVTTDYGADGAPQRVYMLNRYFKEDTQKFYTKEVATVSNRTAEYITYEEKYDANSIYHVNNIVPVFKEENISAFEIVKDKNNKGYSIATFNSTCPSAFACTSEVVEYTVTIDKDFYFSKIEFTLENGDKTSTYTYTFNKFNSDVEISFPSDLNDY